VREIKTYSKRGALLYCALLSECGFLACGAESHIPRIPFIRLWVKFPCQSFPCHVN
jgi:hypothetical protein